MPQYTRTFLEITYCMDCILVFEKENSTETALIRFTVEPVAF